MKYLFCYTYDKNFNRLDETKHYYSNSSYINANNLDQAIELFRDIHPYARIIFIKNI